MSGGAVAFRLFWKLGRGSHSEICRQGGQSISLSNARAWALGHLGLRNRSFIDVRRPPTSHIGLGSYPISCRGMIVESVDALKGAVGLLGLNRPLQSEGDVKYRLWS